MLELDFGVVEDFAVVPAPADYDADGHVDPAFYFQTLGAWYLAISTANGQIVVAELGIASDPDVLPIAADYDGDSAADVGIYYKPNKNWYIFRSGLQQESIFEFGAADEVPVLNRVQPILGTPSLESGTIGATVTLVGMNFGNTQGASSVRFNGTLATPMTWSNTSITVAVPSGATSPQQ